MGVRSNGKWVLRYRWHGACAHNVDIEKLAGICWAQMAVEGTVGGALMSVRFVQSTLADRIQNKPCDFLYPASASLKASSFALYYLPSANRRPNPLAPRPLPTIPLAKTPHPAPPAA